MTKLFALTGIVCTRSRTCWHALACSPEEGAAGLLGDSKRHEEVGNPALEAGNHVFAVQMVLVGQHFDVI